MVLVVGGLESLEEIKKKQNESESEEEMIVAAAYHNFVESFKSEATKKVYVESFDSFLEFLQQQQQQLKEGGRGGGEEANPGGIKKWTLTIIIITASTKQDKSY